MPPKKPPVVKEVRTVKTTTPSGSRMISSSKQTIYRDTSNGQFAPKPKRYFKYV